MTHRFRRDHRNRRGGGRSRARLFLLTVAMALALISTRASAVPVASAAGLATDRESGFAQLQSGFSGVALERNPEMGDYTNPAGNMSWVTRVEGATGLEGTSGADATGASWRVSDLSIDTEP